MAQNLYLSQRFASIFIDIKMFLHYVKVAWRSLLHYRVQSVISIAGLSVGLLCFGLCLYISRYIYSANTGFPNHDQIFEVILECSGSSGNTFSIALPPLAVPNMEQQALKGVDIYTSISNIKQQSIGIESDNGKIYPYRVQSVEVDAHFADVFSRRFIYGDKSTAFTLPNAVILTQSMAEKVFGKINPIGKKVNVYYNKTDNAEREKSAIVESYTITAVIEDIPENVTFSFLQKLDMLFCNDSHGYLTDERMQRSMSGCTTYALCRSGITAKDLNNQSQAKEIRFDYISDDSPVIFAPMGDKHLNSVFFQLAQILMLIGTLILLTALLNFYVFTVGQFLNRMREFAIRKSLGAGFIHLFGLLFTEMFITLFISLLAALCLSEWVYTEGEFQLNEFSLPLVKNELIFQLLQYFSILLILNAIICFVVVWRIESADMQKSIKQGRKRYVRNTILTIQVFICLLFMGAASILKMQTDKMTESVFATLTAEKKEHILSLSLEHAYLTDYRDVILEKLRALANVEDVLETADVVISAWYTFVYPSPEIERDKNIGVSLINAGSNFASFFHIPVKEGIMPQNIGDVLVSKSLIEKTDFLSPGDFLYEYDHSAHLISGIVDDFHTSAYTNIRELYVRTLNPAQNVHCYIKAVQGKKEAVQESVKNVLSEFFPESMPPLIKTFNQEIEDAQKLENTMCRAITSLAIICLIITLLGVYSAITLDTRRREKEVAIRKINGAGSIVLIWLFGRFYLIVLAITSSLALPVLILLSRQMLQEYAIAVSPGWGFVLGLILCTGIFIGLTIIYRILHVVQLNPAEVIKNE